jgi:hypothetical protein
MAFGGIKMLAYGDILYCREDRLPFLPMEYPDLPMTLLSAGHTEVSQVEPWNPVLPLWYRSVTHLCTLVGAGSKTTAFSGWRTTAVRGFVG